VRLKNHEYRDSRKGNLKFEFTKQELSSYSGLEVFRRYFQVIGLHFRIRRAFRAHHLSGDYGITDCILVFFALWLTGGKRLRHVSFIADDPLVKRLCGLLKIPSDRTLSRWLGQYTLASLEVLAQLNSEIVRDQIRKLGLPRITLDFDGTVLTAGHQVKWAFRGYNPHKRYAPSYYPLLCHVAQTGHFLHSKNRPGNVHDSKGALGVIRDCVAQAKTIAPGLRVEVRLDAAFFHRDIITWLDRNGVEYAVKVPMWKWIGIKEKINQAGYWYHHGESLSSRRFSLFLRTWGREVSFTVVRHKVSDKKDGKKFVQLDLFTPDDGIYEYSVIQTNKTMRPDHLWDFYNGRSAMEHQIAEIKNEFAFDSIPTKEYQANSAYQQISLLAYNLVRNFQIDTGLAETRAKTSSRTNLFTFDSLKTLRFEFIAVAGRVVNCSGRLILKMAQNARREKIFAIIGDRLDEMPAA
jgi:hypothetical protein